MTLTLFDWQRAVHAADGLPDQLRLLALRVSLDSAAASTHEVVVNESAVAADMRCSGRTVWRRLEQLIDAGWLVQTAKPTRPGRGGSGAGARRARYRLLVPGSESSAMSPWGASDDQHGSCANATGVVVTRSTPSSDDASVTLSDDRLASSDTPPPTDGTRSPSSSDTPRGPMARIQTGTTNTNAAAAAREADLDPIEASGPIAILASKIAQHPQLRALRWDTLGPDRTARIEALISTHGDQPLVDCAITTLRHPAPVFAQAFLASWEAMPSPGRRLAVVRTPKRRCPHHTYLDLDEAGICRACASERAGGDL